MIKVAVCGALGRMGQEVVKAVEEAEGMELSAVIDLNNVGQELKSGVKIYRNIADAISENKIDVVVDFTIPDSVYNNAIAALTNGVRPVIGTTGLSSEQLKEIETLSKEKNIGALIAPNFAIGAILMMKFSAMAAKYFSNAEIIELHHNQKKDAPSGTAIKTAEMMKQARDEYGTDNIEEIEIIKSARGAQHDGNIHIHSVRLPGYVASQEVIFGGQGQTLKIRHDSIDRTSFMPGVVLSIRHVMSNNNFVYGLENIL